jgi:arsenite methyltransferase
MAESTDIRETVRERYAAAARSTGQGCCGSGPGTCAPVDDAGVFGGHLYDEAERADVPEGAVGASLVCGVPTAVADLSEGETVLDLGSGAGADVLISARRVGPTGRAIGLDMTDEMLELARALPTRPRSSARPPASCGPAGASRCRTSSPTPTWTDGREPTWPPGRAASPAP